MNTLSLLIQNDIISKLKKYKHISANYLEYLRYNKQNIENIINIELTTEIKDNVKLYKLTKYKNPIKRLEISTCFIDPKTNHISKYDHNFVRYRYIEPDENYEDLQINLMKYCIKNKKLDFTLLNNYNHQIKYIYKNNNGNRFRINIFDNDDKLILTILYITDLNKKMDMMCFNSENDISPNFILYHNYMIGWLYKNYRIITKNLRFDDYIIDEFETENLEHEEIMNYYTNTIQPLLYKLYC